jgi:hypothetical protein
VTGWCLNARRRRLAALAASSEEDAPGNGPLECLTSENDLLGCLVRVETLTGSDSEAVRVASRR